MKDRVRLTGWWILLHGSLLVSPLPTGVCAHSQCQPVHQTLIDLWSKAAPGRLAADPASVLCVTLRMNADPEHRLEHEHEAYRGDPSDPSWPLFLWLEACLCGKGSSGTGFKMLDQVGWEIGMHMRKHSAYRPCIWMHNECTLMPVHAFPACVLESRLALPWGDGRGPVSVSRCPLAVPLLLNAWTLQNVTSVVTAEPCQRQEENLDWIVRNRIHGLAARMHPYTT